MQCRLQRPGNLHARSFDCLAAQLDAWLGDNLTRQQRADLFVADLVRDARAFVARRHAMREKAAGGMPMIGRAEADHYARAVAAWTAALSLAPGAGARLAPAGESISMPLPTVYSAMGVKARSLALPLRYLQGIVEKHADLPHTALLRLP